MPSETLRAYLEDLRRGARAAAEAADDVDGHRRAINGHVDAVRSSWTGPAAGAYLPVWEEIDEECAKMLADLRWIGRSLSASAAAYAEMERRHVGTIRTVDPGTR